MTMTMKVDGREGKAMTKEEGLKDGMGRKKSDDDSASWHKRAGQGNATQQRTMGKVEVEVEDNKDENG